jgi:hypothetical protein
MSDYYQYKLRIVGIAHHFAPDLFAAAEASTTDVIVRRILKTWIPLELVHEPTNPNDRNAVEVFLPAWACIDGKPKKLGYCPRNIAPDILKAQRQSTHFSAALDSARLIDPTSQPVWSARLQTNAPPHVMSSFTAADFTASFDDARRDIMGQARRPHTTSRVVHDWI